MLARTNAVPFTAPISAKRIFQKTESESIVQVPYDSVSSDVDTGPVGRIHNRPDRQEGHVESKHDSERPQDVPGGDLNPSKASRILHDSVNAPQLGKPQST